MVAMNRIKQLFSLLIRVFFTFRRVNSFSINNRDVDYIVWAPDFFSVRFLYGDNLQKVLATYYYLKRRGKDVSVWTKNDIGCCHSKNIIFFGSHVYNSYGFSNYMDSLVNITSNLEAQNNLVFPNSKEVIMWENKSYMHERFEKLEINTPKTLVFDLDDVLDRDIDIKYPFLVKEEHSCSSLGVHKVSDRTELKKLIKSIAFRRNNKNVIIQELLDIRRDLRVIFVGNEIVLHYWRINTSSEWKPTSTSTGSEVDFDFFPKQWEKKITESFNKLGMRTGAFDIAWDGDSLDSEPYILEVSTFYQPNPRPSNVADLKYYGSWKKSVRLRNSYQKSVVDVIFSIQKELVDVLLGR